MNYNTPREIPVIFHNGSNYDYHFIIKGLAKEFEGDCECLGENKEKYIKFSVPIKKEYVKDSDQDNNKKEVIIYRIKFIDSFRFMSTSLSNLVDNLSDGIHNKEKSKDCDSNCEYISLSKKGRLLFECFGCKKRYSKKFDKKLTKKSKNKYKFCNKDIDKSMFLLRKGAYPYEYMDDWERFDEEQLPYKSDFDSNLNDEKISEIDYRHAEKIFNKFNIKNLGKYHDLYVQSDTLLLAGVFENFRNIFIKVYKLDPAYLLSAPGLAWQACLKKTGVELELISDIDKLLMIEKGIRGGICHSICRHVKANNKYMKVYKENEESSYIIYMDANNLYGFAMSKNLPVDCFQWVENLSEIEEDFIENYYDDSSIEYFIEADVEYPTELHSLHSDLPFLPERMEINNCKQLVCNLYDKLC